MLTGNMLYNDIKDLKIYEIFGVFLIRIYKQLCKTSFKILVNYLLTYVEALNKDAWEILHK
jgi:hypothetical protein